MSIKQQNEFNFMNQIEWTNSHLIRGLVPDWTILICWHWSSHLLLKLSSKLSSAFSLSISLSYARILTHNHLVQEVNIWTHLLYVYINKYHFSSPEIMIILLSFLIVRTWQIKCILTWNDNSVFLFVILSKYKIISLGLITQ